MAGGIQLSSLRTAVIHWGITVCYMGLIFYLSSIEGTGLPSLTKGLDKILHICIYGGLAFLSRRSFSKSGIKRHAFLLSFILAVIYGISDEIHQSYVPGRDVSVGDIFADALGALLGGYLAGLRR